LSQSIDTIKLDTLAQELATIQQTGSKRIALLGSRHVPITHQNLIEMMTYALILSGNRIITLVLQAQTLRPSGAQPRLIPTYSRSFYPKVWNVNPKNRASN
jgi:hypothetical protein